MVTRRTFLTANMTAAVASAFGLDRPMLDEVAQGEPNSENQLPRSHRDFWNDWPDYVTRKMNQARN